MPEIKFGWIAPVMGAEKTGWVPIVMSQQETILPVVAQHFDSVWIYDHLYGLIDPADPWLECWTTLTWLAARFPTLRVGPIVLGLSYRNPALVAKMAATLQTLSGGRLVLGIGAGWREDEHRAFGYPFPPAAVRRRQLDEALEIIRRMWTEPQPSFQGEYFGIHDAYCRPQPPPPPIMIGSSGEAILPLVARRADWWDVWFWTAAEISAEAYRPKGDALNRAAEAIGRDPASIPRSISSTGCRLPRDSAQSQQWLDLLRPFVDLGVTRFLFDFGNPRSPEPILRFAEEVIAPLNRV